MIFFKFFYFASCLYRVRILYFRIGLNNSEVSRILREISILLEIDGVKYKPRAYEKAAKSIEALDEEVAAIYRRGGLEALMEIPYVGASIARKIAELITTGRLKYYEDLKAKYPIDIRGLTSIEGIGPKTIKTLYEKLGVKSVEDLEDAAKKGLIRRLPGFREKTEKKILEAIKFYREAQSRFPLGYVLPLVEKILDRLKSRPNVEKVVVAGSVRRMKETVGDIDILAVTNDVSLMDYFVSMPEVVTIHGKGRTKSSVKLNIGLDVDLRIVDRECFGAALQYFTGSKEHNIALRRIAQSKGWKLNEYGLFDEKGIKIAGKKEDEVYHALGLNWIPPELRENRGEVEAALNNKLPNLVGYSDLRGDLQVHTNWSDGVNSIEEMALQAKRIGLEYIVISDHAKGLAMTGMDEEKLLNQMSAIDEVNDRIEGIRVLKGVEANILKDGSLDVSDNILDKLDLAGAAIHSHFNLEKEEMTKRLLKVIENPNIQVIYHPTGREIGKRPEYKIDLEKIFDAALDHGKILDIDAFPERLDLRDIHIRYAVEKKVKLDISSDAHNKQHFKYLRLGIAQARRGWASRDDIVNTKPLHGFLKIVKG